MPFDNKNRDAPLTPQEWNRVSESLLSLSIEIAKRVDEKHTPSQNSEKFDPSPNTK